MEETIAGDNERVEDGNLVMMKSFFMDEFDDGKDEDGKVDLRLGKCEKMKVKE